MNNLRNIKIFKSKYRVVKDGYLGYELQIKRWWYPFYTQVGINTFGTLESAVDYARKHSQAGEFITYLDV